MRNPLLFSCVIGFLAVASGQLIEERSSVRNPDGSTSHNSRSSFSHATFSEEATGSDGVVKGRTLHRDSTGRTYGQEWSGKDGKMEVKNIEGGKMPDIGARTGLGGFGAPGFGSGGFGNPGFGSGLGNSGFGSGLGNTGFGSGLGNPGFGSGVGTPGFGSGIGNVGGSGFGPGFSGGFPGQGSIPWASFGNFDQFDVVAKNFPQFNFANAGFQQPIQIPNYSRFLLGGVGANPNLANGGMFANLAPGFGLGNGFGGVGSGGFGPGGGFSGGFGGPGYGQRSYKHEVDPATGKQTYSYSESSGHSTSSNTKH